MIKSLFNLPGKQDIFKYIITTNKTNILVNQNKYSFLVNPTFNKTLNKNILESLFKEKVLKINTLNLPRKQKRIKKCIGWKPNYKKVIVTFKKDIKINLIKED